MASQLPRLIADAEQAAGRRDWNGAEKALRGAMRAIEADPLPKALRGTSPAPDAGPARTLQRNLAVVLANRASESSGQAMAMIAPAAQSPPPAHRQEIDRRVKDFVGRREVRGAGTIMIVSFLALFALGLFAPVDENWPTLGESPWSRTGLAAGFGLVFMWPISAGLSWLVDFFSRATDIARPLGKAPRCAICPRDSSYRVDVPGHGERSLCATHASELEAIMNGLPSPPMARQLLESARVDLEEAQRLDPSLDGVKQNLIEINGILGRLLPEPKTKKRSKRR